MKDILPLYGLTAPLFPMAAKDGREKKEALIDDPTYVFERKFDGSRYLTAEGRFFSRHPSEDKSSPETIGWPVEKTDQLPHLAYFFEEFPGMIFDGEIMRLDIEGRSDDVVTILGCTPEEAIKRQKATGYLGYMVFDLLAVDYRMITDMSWDERRKKLDHWWRINVSAVSNSLTRFMDRHFGPVLTLSEVAWSREQKLWMLGTAEKLGWEGVMAKNITKVYTPSTATTVKRPEHVWYKLKKHIRADVVIMGFTEGKGKFAGMIGSVEFGQWRAKAAVSDKELKKMGSYTMTSIGGLDHILVNCGSCSGMDDTLRKDITDNRERYMHRVVEIEAMERTKAGQFRHPQWKLLREDKTSTMCIWGEC